MTNIFAAEFTTTDVPTLGPLKGFSFPQLGGLKQYYGVPFGSIPGRFQKPELLTEWPAEGVDATKFGAFCVQPPRNFYPLPGTERPWIADSKPEQSEFDLLNLNISVPPANQGTKMPVMVFIHGGANTYAANSAPMYDGINLARISSEQGTPTIIVTINYRMGPFGFLASTDLKLYNEKLGSRGVGNYGAWDQIIGLRWIQRYIEHFGGEPKKVTLFGQSAGSQATHLHLLRQEPLFSRAILQSGLTPLCGIFSIKQYDEVYFKILKELGIDTSLSPEERVQELLKVDAVRLSDANAKVAGIAVVTMAYADDGEILPDGKNIPSWGELGVPGQIPEFVEATMVGDCKNECIIWEETYKSLCKDAKTFLGYLKKNCSAELYELITESYKITPDLSSKEVFAAVETFTTDAMYLLPNYCFVRGNPDVLAFHFDQSSEFDNAWGGYAHHSLDNAYVWGNLTHTFPEHGQKLAPQMSKIWLDFANGTEPFGTLANTGKYYTFGPSGQCGALVDRESDATRKGRYEIWDKIIKQGLVEEFGRIGEDICLDRTSLHGYVA